jgi:hypothetical protein
MPNKIFFHGRDGKPGLEKALSLGFRQGKLRENSR